MSRCGKLSQRHIFPRVSQICAHWNLRCVWLSRQPRTEGANDTIIPAYWPCTAHKRLLTVFLRHDIQRSLLIEQTVSMRFRAVQFLTATNSTVGVASGTPLSTLLPTVEKHPNRRRQLCAGWNSP